MDILVLIDRDNGVFQTPTGSFCSFVAEGCPIYWEVTYLPGWVKLIRDLMLAGF